MRMSVLSYVVIHLFLANAAPANTAEIEVGDSAVAVVSALGQPRGRLQSGSMEMLTYERGTVEIENGRVTAVALISEEELAELRIRRQREAEERRRAQEARRKQLLEEGTVEKKRVLADASFKDKPPQEQVGYWRNFIAQYPDVPASEEYQAALEELREQERAAEEARLRAEANKKEEPGPKPKISGKRMRKLRRSGEWEW